MISGYDYDYEYMLYICTWGTCVSAIQRDEVNLNRMRRVMLLRKR